MTRVASLRPPGVRLDVESVSALPWNDCPESRGISGRFAWNTQSCPVPPSEGHFGGMAQMEDQYPYLVHWKQKGFDQLPNIPPEEIIKFYKAKALQAFRKSSLHLIGLSEKNRESIEEAFLCEVEPILIQMVAQRHEEKVLEAAFDRGFRCLEAEGKARLKEPRDRVMLNLGKQILPETKGGGIVFTEGSKRILKRNYLEMQECIREVRRYCNVPLKDIEDYDEAQGNMVDVPYVKNTVPWIGFIFTDEEIPRLALKPSIAETALNIMSRRLRKCRLKYYIPSRTLRNILKDADLGLI
jgi:hypothetical protein